MDRPLHLCQQQVVQPMLLLPIVQPAATPFPLEGPPEIGIDDPNPLHPSYSHEGIDSKTVKRNRQIQLQAQRQSQPQHSPDWHSPRHSPNCDSTPSHQLQSDYCLHMPCAPSPC